MHFLKNGREIYHTCTKPCQIQTLTTALAAVGTVSGKKQRLPALL